MVVQVVVPEVLKRFSVTVGEAELVLPAEPKEDHVYFLTNLDQNVAMIVKTVYLYPAKEFEAPGGKKADPVEVIRDSLAKVLVHYYPLAGRLGISAEGKLQVNYNSQGVVFVEAKADIALVDLGDISKPDEGLHQLLYTVPDATNILETPLVVAQVTKFKCGGFVVGLSNQHSMFDGIAANEFVKAWGEVARGLPISTPPVLDRTILRARVPPQIDFSHDEFADIVDLSKDDRLVMTDEKIVHKSFYFSPEDIMAMKKKTMEEGGLKRCTAFEVLSALVWKARTTALEMVPQQQTRLYFAVDGRTKFKPNLPSGYMGNGIVLTYSLTTAADLCDKPLHHAVSLVQQAVDLIDDRYMRSAIDYFETTHARPSLAGSVVVTAWARLPFHSTDFGWGEPWQCGPVVLPDREVVLFLAHGKERKSMDILLGLPPKVMNVFERLIKV